MKLFLRSGFGLVVAFLLSLVMVTPAAAVDGVPDPSKPMPSNVTYKWMFDKYRWATQLPPSGPASPYRIFPSNVSAYLNPQGPGTYTNSTGGTTTRLPSQTPLVGKIVQPGTSLVKAPVAIAPTSPFTNIARGVLGASRLIGGAGIGIGGQGTPVANYREIAAAKGIPSGCIDTFKQPACTKEQQDTLFSISTCQITATCVSHGAVDTDGNPIDAFWKDGFIPFVEDLWAWITGQADGDVPSTSHVVVNQSRGCTTKFDGESTGPTSLRLHKTTNIVSAKPASGVHATYWESNCGPAQQAAINQAGASFHTTCILPSTGRTVNSTGTPYGTGGGINTSFDPSTGLNKVSLCGGNTGAVLQSFRVYNTLTQEAASGPVGAGYSSVLFSEWINPDPNMNTIDDTKITTSWDCTDGDGTIRTLSKAQTGMGGFIEPVCPPGTELTRSRITSSEPSTGSRVLDETAQVPGAQEQYPLCVNGVGCTMDVMLDGSPCTVGRAGCATWPQIYATTPSRVGCQWGPYALDVANCLSFSNGYQTEAGVIFDPRSRTWVAVDAFGNPVQPNPEPYNPANPNPSPGVSPGTGTGTTPGTPGFPGSGTNPSTGDGCLGAMWTWNPVDWVMVPVQCALQWAFVPKVDVDARIQVMQGQFTDKVPISWFGGGMTNVSGGTCPVDWAITWRGERVSFICGTAAEGIILAFRPVLGAMLVIAALWPLFRSLFYSAIPILKVNPS